jgi:hypothetical protein
VTAAEHIEAFVAEQGGATAWQIHVGTGLPIGTVRVVVLRMYARGQLARRKVAAQHFCRFRPGGEVWLYEPHGDDRRTETAP